MLNSAQSPKKEVMSRNYGGKESKCCTNWINKSIHRTYLISIINLISARACGYRDTNMNLIKIF